MGEYSSGATQQNSSLSEDTPQLTAGCLRTSHDGSQIVLTTYLVRRIGLGILTILTIASFVFFVLRLTTDPVSVMLPAYATAADRLQLQHTLGLDKPIAVQYILYLRDLVTANLGNSYSTQVPVLQLISERLPATAELISAAAIIAIVLSVPVGVIAAVHRGSAVDLVVTGLSLAGFAIPAFWLAIMLIMFFSVDLRWLPSSGIGGWSHLLLPAISLAMWPFGQFTRVLRSEMIDVLQHNYIRTARAKGLSRFKVHFKHALKAAALPYITMVGLSFGAMLGGAIVTETVFAWPGMGQLVVESVTARDLPVVQAVVVYFAAAYVTVNIAIDVGYTLLDPRVRLG
jgi:peptide/nickel transport system permease protein